MDRNNYITKGLVNTRGVSTNLPQMKRETQAIQIDRSDYDNGYRIGSSTLNFKPNEKREIRMTNTYVFGRIKLDVIWNLTITLKVMPPGMMNIHPHLLKIRMYDNDQVIDSDIRTDLIKNIIQTINESIGILAYDDRYIPFDQIEGLAKIGLISRPDALLERLVGIAETRGELDTSTLRYIRMIPDSSSLTLSVDKIIR